MCVTITACSLFAALHKSFQESTSTSAKSKRKASKRKKRRTADVDEWDEDVEDTEEDDHEDVEETEEDEQHVVSTATAVTRCGRVVKKPRQHDEAASQLEEEIESAATTLKNMHDSACLDDPMEDPSPQDDAAATLMSFAQFVTQTGHSSSGSDSKVDI